MVRNGASPILRRLLGPLPIVRIEFPTVDKNETDGGALTGRLSCGHSETGQTNRRNTNLDGHALNGGSKTALHSTVVRLYHSRPVPFRCRFQNARSVLRNLHISASIWSVQLNRILGGFLELESRSFWLDTIPLHEGKAASRVVSVCHPAWRPTNHPSSVR